MAERVLGAAEESTDPDIPDPELITTLNQLAEALRMLRIAAGNPSFRTISGRITNQGAHVPYNTVHDAMSGKHMPKRDVVLNIVGALNAANIASWRAAWNRVERGRQNLAGLGSRTPPQPRTAPSPVVQTAGGNSQIAAVNRRDAAALIESQPIAQVVHALTAMPSADAAKRMDLVAADRAAHVLTRMDERQAASILGDMDPGAVAQTLTAMDPTAAAELIEAVNYAASANILRHLSASTGAAIISQIKTWPRFLGDVLNMTAAEKLSFVMAMPDDEVKKFFADQNNATQGSRFLEDATPESAARALRAVPAAVAARWLENSPTDKIAGLVSGLSDEEFLPIFKEMPVQRNAAGLHKGLGAPRLLRLVSLLPKADIRTWRDYLRHLQLLSNAEDNQLIIVMRQTSAPPQA